MIKSMEEFPKLSVSALAVMFQTKWKSKIKNQPNDFLVKEALADLASNLKDDDVGFLYDPEASSEICTQSGELVGKISNSKMPFSYHFRNGVITLVNVLNLLEEYNRIGIIISDCLSTSDAKAIKKEIAKTDAKIYVIGIGQSVVSDDMFYVADAVNLGEILTEIKSEITKY